MSYFNKNNIKNGLLFIGLHVIGSIGMMKIVENSNHHIKMQRNQKRINKN
jgi:hypothetical protein